MNNIKAPYPIISFIGTGNFKEEWVAPNVRGGIEVPKSNGTYTLMSQ